MYRGLIYSSVSQVALHLPPNTGPTETFKASVLPLGPIQSGVIQSKTSTTLNKVFNVQWFLLFLVISSSIPFIKYKVIPKVGVLLCSFLSSGLPIRSSRCNPRFSDLLLSIYLILMSTIDSHLATLESNMKTKGFRLTKCILKVLFMCQTISCYKES